MGGVRLKAPPAYREKKRYLILEFRGRRPDNVYEWLRGLVTKWYGEYGIASSGLEMKEGVIVVSRDWVPYIRALLVFQREYVVRVKRVSGSLRKVING